MMLLNSIPSIESSHSKRLNMKKCMICSAKQLSQNQQLICLISMQRTLETMIFQMTWFISSSVATISCMPFQKITLPSLR